jgi:hypothetical protein
MWEFTTQRPVKEDFPDVKLVFWEGQYSAFTLFKRVLLERGDKVGR